MKIDITTEGCLALIAILLMPLLVSCSSDNDFNDLKRYVAEVKERKARPIEPLPEIKAYKEFIFNAEGLRDPFQKLNEAAVEKEENNDVGVTPNFDRERESLEAYPLDTLRMVGTLSLNGSLWGLVRAGDGVVHRVQPGNYLGQNYGEIVALTEGSIEIGEFIRTEKGKWIEREASLAIAE